MDKRRLLLIAVFAFAAAYTLHVASRQLRVSGGIDTKVTAPASSVSPASRALRPNYPYSVIPGGAYSVEELQSAVQRDRLVNGHFADFNLTSARLVRLTDDRFQYVSYRLRNQIYWTRNKLRIPKGEILLTDGYNFARTRCGNRLSSKPKAEITPEQPSERVLSLPPFTPALLKKGEVTLAPPPELEVAQAAPPLPFDLPRLAPYLPGEGLAGMPTGPQIWPSLQSYPPPAGIAYAGPPPFGPGYLPIRPVAPGGPVQSPNSPPSSIPVVPGVLPLPILPILPVVPIAPGTPTPPISEVPEPASLSLFAASICGCLWVLTRVIRTDRRKQA